MQSYDDDICEINARKTMPYLIQCPLTDTNKYIDHTLDNLLLHQTWYTSHKGDPSRVRVVDCKFRFLVCVCLGY